MKSKNKLSAKKFLTNDGVSIITIIIVLSSISYALFQGLSVFFTKTKQTKAVNELTISAKIFTNGLFNYTLFALKERWCMDNNWGKDEKCSSTGDMNEAITSKFNLERFLWSQSSETDIKERYLKLYAKYPDGSPRLEKMSYPLTMDQLEKLGGTHPVNLIIDENIKRCIDKVDIEIEKVNTAVIKPQGDEVYLQIGILGKQKTDILQSCSRIASSLNLRGLVVVYPRTLNQFSLIKAKHLDLRTFGTNAGVGVNFHGPVYVQGDFIIPSVAKKNINFRDTVIIGEGIFKKDNNAFVAASYGDSSSTFLGQIPSVKGIRAGIALDAEIDEGLSFIFGDAYEYPANTNMASCKERQILKDNYTRTRDSRLFFKPNGSGLTMALSHQNEFRERTTRGVDANDFHVKLVGGNPWGTNVPEVSYTENSKDDMPIFEIDFLINDQNANLPTALMGRNTTLKIDLVKKSFYQGQLAIISTPSSNYLRLSNLNLHALGSGTNNFQNAYNSLNSACNSSRLREKVTIPESCKRVEQNIPSVKNDGKEGDEDAPPRGTCERAYEDDSWNKNRCESDLATINSRASTYASQEASLRSNIAQLANNVPAVEIKTSEVASNAENLNINLINPASMSNPLIGNLSNISFDIKVYDFAVENNGNNPTRGSRRRSYELPGPNDDTGYGKSNKLIARFITSGGVNRLNLETVDGQNIRTKNGSGWASLKTDYRPGWLDYSSNAEPPGNSSGNSVSYPEIGMSVAEAKKLDQDCDVDTTAAAPPSWDVSFTPMTSFSWLYNITSSGVSITDPSQAKPLDTYIFDASNNDMSVGFYSGVPTRSIVDKCIVRNTIDFVFGFYVCKSLRIEARSTPLNLVGTFIVNDLIIDNSAANAGVNFYSIWQREAIKLLQDKKHLKRENTLGPAGDNRCLSMTTSGWNPYLDTDTIADTIACSPAKFLYQGANNFNWTTVDPELGIAQDDKFVATTQSKIVNRYRRYGTNVLWQREDYK